LGKKMKKIVSTHILQCSVAMHWLCGEIFNDRGTANLQFLAPQDWHNAPVDMKLGMNEHTTGSVSCPKFHLMVNGCILGP